MQVEKIRADLAQFFCEDLNAFKLEDCFKILYTFITKWKVAAQENAQRKKQEVEAENRKKAREETLKKRAQLGSSNQLTTEDGGHERVWTKSMLNQLSCLAEILILDFFFDFRVGA